ncbi:hypothetical protein ACFQX6_22555 [Streptosporangium lutulentum]
MSDQSHDALNPASQIPDGLRVPAISRRRLLQLSALGVGAFSAAPLLAACGADSTSTQAASPGGAAKKGGDLIIVRDHDAVNMDKTTVFSNGSIWTYNQIYEPLVAMTDDGQG